MESEQINCEACLPDAQKVSNKVIDNFIKVNATWQLLNGDGVQKLGKSFNFSNFIQAQRFTNSVGDMASSNYYIRIWYGYGEVVEPQNKRSS